MSNMRPMVIQGRIAPPADSWWTYYGPHEFTRAVEREQLPRMSQSIFTSIRCGVTEAAPRLASAEEDV